MRLVSGRYVVEETIRWWRLPAPDAPAVSPGDGTFTIRLTYEVR